VSEAVQEEHYVKNTTAIVGLSALACTAAANTETFNGSFPLATTNWQEMFQIPAFDTQNGLRVLDGVCIDLTGTVVGQAAAENLDAQAAVLELFLEATISIELDDGSGTALASVIPVADEMFNADPFDGSIDFGGTSGITLNDLTGTKMETTELTSGADDLSAFIDTGSVALLADAEGTSIATGSGNIVSSFTTEAELEWEITYKFSIVPAPGATAVLGFAGLVAARRRR
jgi:hypothetical protein